MTNKYNNFMFSQDQATSQDQTTSLQLTATKSADLVTGTVESPLTKIRASGGIGAGRPGGEHFTLGATTVTGVGIIVKVSEFATD